MEGLLMSVDKPEMHKPRHRADAPRLRTRLAKLTKAFGHIINSRANHKHTVSDEDMVKTTLLDVDPVVSTPPQSSINWELPVKPNTGPMYPAEPFKRRRDVLRSSHVSRETGQQGLDDFDRVVSSLGDVAARTAYPESMDGRADGLDPTERYQWAGKHLRFERFGIPANGPNADSSHRLDHVAGITYVDSDFALRPKVVPPNASQN